MILGFGFWGSHFRLQCRIGPGSAKDEGGESQASLTCHLGQLLLRPMSLLPSLSTKVLHVTWANVFWPSFLKGRGWTKVEAQEGRLEGGGPEGRWEPSGSPKDWEPKPPQNCGGPDGERPEGWGLGARGVEGPKFRVFSPSPASIFAFFFFLLGGLPVELRPRVETVDQATCPFGRPDPGRRETRTKSRRAATGIGTKTTERDGDR